MVFTQAEVRPGNTLSRTLAVSDLVCFALQTSAFCGKSLSKMQSHPLRLVPVSLNTSPNNKILDWTKLKAFAEMKLNVAKMMISLFDRVVNIVVKEKNAGNQHLLLFPQCFPKLS